MRQSLLLARRLSSLIDYKTLKKTPLYDLHVKNGARMVPFAGWTLPLQYEEKSILESVRHTRQATSLFDVSHMLQTKVVGEGAMAFLEGLMPLDAKGLKPNGAQYSVILNEKGGIIDDVIVTKIRSGEFRIVSNAGRATVISQLLTSSGRGSGHKDLNISHTNNALLALQGPNAMNTLINSKIIMNDEKILISQLPFMNSITLNETSLGVGMTVTRCGYTGEDGFELSIAHEAAPLLAEKLLLDSNVSLAGLGARDILRLEAALCLYGNDINEEITPIEAGLSWVISKRRLEFNDTIKFPGLDIIKKQLENDLTRRRVGFILKEGGPPPRTGAEIVNKADLSLCGVITSGSFSPHCEHNIAMGYISATCPEALKKLMTLGDTGLAAVVRGKLLPLTLVRMPFVPYHYYRSKK